MELINQVNGGILGATVHRFRQFVGAFNVGFAAIGCFLILAGCTTTGVKSEKSGSTMPLVVEEKACKAANGVEYNPWEIFDPKYTCYVEKPAGGSPVACPDEGTVCANHALSKLADYESTEYQDLLFAPHRGVWGGTYGSTDPNFKTAPAQNTINSFNLANSFATDYPVNSEGKNYGAFLRGRVIEIDATTFSNNVISTQTQGIINHYLTTASTVEGSINDYLTNMDNSDMSAYVGHLEKRDYSASPTLLGDMITSNATKKAFVDQTDNTKGAIVLIDPKARQGEMQCQVFNIQPSDKENYEKYYCEYRTTANQDLAKSEVMATVASEIYAAGGLANAVIKTSLTYDDTKNNGYFTLDEIKKYQWQPHPGSGMSVETTVQYIHDWLVNVPRSIFAWEFLLPDEQGTANLMFCVTDYSSQASGYPYGQLQTRNVSSMNDTSACEYGPYVNMMHYLKCNTGNPNYFGFTTAQKEQVLISGNRANLWLLTTASPIGTSDRYYRWQTLGADPFYNMSDPVRSLSYPYMAYQIFTGDRMAATYQVMKDGLFPEYGGPNDKYSCNNPM